MKQSLLLVAFTICCFGQLWAQQTKPTEKFKPPVVKTEVGIRGDSSQVVKEEAVQLIGLPLKVVDAKNNRYPVETYQFLYKRKSFIEDPQTGKAQPVVSTVGQRFYQSPLPEIWVNNIKDQLKPGEELLFFDILVKDQKGRTFYAPSITIFVK